nr:4578_t:CDS:2 [Entrophospora candida]
MSDNREKKNEEEARDWLNSAKKNKFITFVDFDKFKDVVEIENSAHAIVKKAFSKPLGREVTLTTFKMSLRDLVKELQKYQKVAAHNNILSYIGLAQDPDRSNLYNYSLILDYAKDNLREHLSANELTWAQKLTLAGELTSGLYCIHDSDMFHGNLGTIKLHNFGKFKKVEETKLTLAQYFESIPYLDPQHLKNPKEFFRDQMVADIYSLGVLLWEISSQKPPFEKYSNEPCKLCYKIVYENLRESPVPNTPKFYEDIYKECWQTERDLRPNAEDVLECLVAEDSANFD